MRIHGSGGGCPTAGGRYIPTSDAATSDASKVAVPSASGTLAVEFVSFAEAWPELEDGGVLPADEAVALPPPPPSSLATLALTLAEIAASFRLGPAAAAPTLEDGETLLEIETSKVGESLDHLLHKLHLAPVVAMPRTRWRSILDAIGFSLAEHRRWQEIEAEATLILNTRDALVCGPADLKTLRTIVEALLADGAGPEDGLVLIPASASLLVEILPGPTSSVRIEVAAAPLAASVRDLIAPSA